MTTATAVPPTTATADKKEDPPPIEPRQDWSWLRHSACRDRPGDFDIDVIRRDRDTYTKAIFDALNNCRRDCPVLQQCRDYTATLTGVRKPKDLIQAGRIFSTREDVKKRTTGTCRHKHKRALGPCALCEAENARTRALYKRKKDTEEGEPTP